MPSQVLAHTPYKQWAVYRQKHLLIGCHKDAPDTYSLAKMLVATLEQTLPAASARVARAPAASRLASLLSTDQLNVAVVTPQIAADMAGGVGVFEAYDAIPLTLLLPFEDHLLIGHQRLRAHHCWQITRALDATTDINLQNAAAPLQWHRGSQLFVQGLPMPAHE